MLKLRLMLFVCFFSLFLSVYNTDAANYALLIGIEKYNDSEIKGKGCDVKNIQALSRVLKQKFGFSVTTLLNEKASKNDVINNLLKYSGKMSEKDRMFFFFSGSIEKDPLYGGIWWLPYDAFYGDTMSYINSSRIADILYDIKGSVFIVSDSLISPVFFKERPNLNKLKLAVYPLNQKASESGKTFLGKELLDILNNQEKSIKASVVASQIEAYAKSNKVRFKFKPLFLDNKKGDIIFEPVSQGSLKKKEKKFLTTEKTTMSKNTAFLNIDSIPFNAAFYINNKLYGKTPKSGMNFDSGSYQIKVSKKGYKSKKINIVLKNGEERKLKISLEKLSPEKGSLAISTMPSNASIEIMGSDIKYKKGIKLAPGIYRIKLESSFYNKKIIKVEIKEGQNKKIYENLSPLKTYKNSIGQEFARIKKGKFEMGTPDNEFRRGKDEKLHDVLISRDFFIMKKEVSLGQWKKFISETNYRAESFSNSGAKVWIGYKWDKSRKYSWKNPGFKQKDNEPVTCVSYNDAVAFAKWLSEKEGLNYSLPTEAQWEFSIRGKKKTPFGYGNCLSSSQANFAGNSLRGNCPEGQNRKRTIESGLLEPTANGLFDMHGNVLEWCADYYSPYPEGGLTTDPRGAATGKYRVLRGGGWETDINNCRSGNRFKKSSDTSKNNIGFRLVLNP